MSGARPGRSRGHADKLTAACCHCPVTCRPASAAASSKAAVPMRAQGKTGPCRPSGCSSQRGQLLIDVAGLCFDQDLAVRREQLGAAAQQPGGQPADADVAVREQHRSPAALPGQRVEYRAAQRGRPGLAHPGHRGPGDVNAERGNSPLGQRHRQPPGAAAHVKHRTAAAPQQFLVGGVGRPAPPGDLERQRRGRQRSAGPAPRPARARASSYSASSYRAIAPAIMPFPPGRGRPRSGPRRVPAPARRTGSAVPVGPRPRHRRPCPRHAAAAGR